MITIVLGSQRWRRRRAVSRLAPTHDLFGRPGFLFLTDTHRKRRAVLKEFATRDLFEPRVAVLGAFFKEIWARWGDGRPLWSARAIALLAVPIVHNCSYLSTLGAPDETARSLARLLDSTLHHHRPPLHEAVKSGLNALLRATETDRVHPAVALSGVRRLLKNPGPSLQRWIDAQPTLVIDDILQPTPLATRCLLALVDAWDRGENHVVLAFACGDDPAAVLGGEEQEPAFAATRSLRRAVFEHLVANGKAEVVVAQPDGPVPLQHAPDAVPPDATPVQLRQARSVDEEIRFALEELHRVLEQGVDPEDCAIAVCDEALYAPAVFRRAQRRGLPVVPAAGVSLRRTPIGRALVGVVRAQCHLLSPQGWLGLAQDLNRPVEVLQRVLTPAGVLRGSPSTWVDRLTAWGGESDAVATEQRTLAALEQQLDAPPSESALTWSKELLERLEQVGMLELSERSSLDRRAWAHLLSALQALVEDLEIAGSESTSPWDELHRLVQTERVPIPGAGAVPVIGMQELRGLTPSHLWVLGLNRTWPAPTPVSSLVERSEAQRLVTVDRAAEARFLLAQIERNASHSTLCWPATRGTRAALPCPLLRAPEDSVPVQIDGSFAIPGVQVPVQGVLDVAPSIPARFSVTSAEVAVRCPAKFWYGHVLGLRPEDPWDPDLEPRRRGTAFHRILQLFYERRSMQPVLRWDTAAAELHTVAAEVLDQIEAEGGFEPVLQAWARARWLAGLVDERPGGVLAAWLHAEQDRGIAPDAVEQRLRVERGGITFTGVLDRVDREGEMALVIDYKTGRAPTRTAMQAGLALQPLIYLEAVGPGDHASAFQRMAQPNDIRYTGWFGSTTAIRSWGGRGGLGIDPTERAAMLDGAVDRLQAVLSGSIHTTVHGPDLGGCTYCSFKHVCRVVHT